MYALPCVGIAYSSMGVAHRMDVLAPGQHSNQPCTRCRGFRAFLTWTVRIRLLSWRPPSHCCAAGPSPEGQGNCTLRPLGSGLHSLRSLRGSLCSPCICLAPRGGRGLRPQLFDRRVGAPWVGATPDAIKNPAPPRSWPWAKTARLNGSHPLRGL